MNNVQRIVKNIGISGLSQIIIALLSFIFLIYVARYLGESSFGEYSFALSFTSLFVIFADSGIGQLIVRQIARNKNITNKLIVNSILIKCFLSIFTFIIIAVCINLSNYPTDLIKIVYLFGIYTILTSFAQLFMSVFQAHEKLEYNAIVLTIEKITLIILGLIVIYSGYGLLEIAYIYIVSSVVSIFSALLIFFFKIEKPSLTVDFSLWKHLIVDSFPFGLNSLIAMLFFKIDTVLLGFLKDNTAVGIYTAAYNPLLSVVAILTSMTVSALYPVMSRHYITSKDSLKKISLISIRYMMIIGTPLCIGCIILADNFIEILYAGQFLNSILAFQILSLFIPVRLVSSLTGTLLTSINKQGIRTFGVGISVIFNIVLNILLIPSLSYIGACFATVASEILLFAIFMYFVNRYNVKIKVHLYIFKPLIASLIMGTIILFMKNYNILIIIGTAILFYFLLLFLMKTFTNEDLAMFKQIIKKN